MVGDQPRLASPYFMKDASTAGLVAPLEPDLRYAAPECTEGGTNPPGVRYLTPAADMFALGVLFYEFYRFYGAPQSLYTHAVSLSDNSVPQHSYALDALKGLNFSFLSNDNRHSLSRLLQGLVNLDGAMRFTVADVTSDAHFCSGAHALLNAVDNLGSKDIGTQSTQIITLARCVGVGNEGGWSVS